MIIIQCIAKKHLSVFSKKQTLAFNLTNEKFNLSCLTNELIKLRSDSVYRAEYKTFEKYPNFWVKLLNTSDYQRCSSLFVFLEIK